MTYYPPQYDPWAPPPPPPPPPRRRRRGPAVVLGALGLVVLVALGFVAWDLGRPSRTGGTASPLERTWENQQTSNETLDVDAVADEVEPGLVDIYSTLGYSGQQAAGTGMVLTADGQVLTNNHVVAGATSIKVTDVDTGRTYRAEVAGYSRSADVAVLRLQNASDLDTITTGDSAEVSVGDPVVGLGNAGGDGGEPSVSPGKVTALNQSITATDESTGSSEQLTGLIQVDADIQSGDSGGALADGDGKVIGMNTAASTGYQLGRNGRPADVSGFAIPINDALRLARQIEAGTASDTVHIGPSAFIGVSVSDAGGSGALVQQVVSGGPADNAGLTAGDVITGLDGRAIGSATDLTAVMDTLHPGDHVTVTWLDQSGQQHSTSAALVEGPVG
ncbi:trypsin-like peptidase domain-containing protein [Amycolatopsis endophytica]|uniref:S1-C subfamily serine protease n=1 Tax=Amycolatopsis endophytica TaxID=860233 RepID=A0A853B8D6_9PSEU|nr:trypsin-like peptidase domain-containing protein [Amycolatopsis endophytica]NYI91032.1 S1-C subfamily serine protease [Amycolatopsis endophytica]